MTSLPGHFGPFDDRDIVALASSRSHWRRLIGECRLRTVLGDYRTAVTASPAALTQAELYWRERFEISATSLEEQWQFSRVERWRGESGVWREPALAKRAAAIRDEKRSACRWCGKAGSIVPDGRFS